MKEEKCEHACEHASARPMYSQFGPCMMLFCEKKNYFVPKDILCNNKIIKSGQEGKNETKKIHRRGLGN